MAAIASRAFNAVLDNGGVLHLVQVVLGFGVYLIRSMYGFFSLRWVLAGFYV